MPRFYAHGLKVDSCSKLKFRNVQYCKLFTAQNMEVPNGFLTNIRVFKYVSLYWLFSYACSFPLFLHLDSFYVNLNLVFKHTNN